MDNYYYEDTDQLTLHPWGVSEVRDVSQATRYHNRNDRLWKAVLEDLFEDFLCFFFPDARERFDLERGYEFLDKEMDQLSYAEEQAAGVRHVDKLAKVFLKNDSKKYNLLHVEIQGQKSKEDFPARMYRYWYRIRDRYGMPVMSIAILTDTNKHFHPKAYIEENPKIRLTFEFDTYKVLEQDEEELRAHVNSLALVIRAALLAGKTKRSGDQKRLAAKRDLLEELIERKLDKTRQRKIFEFLNHIILFNKAETIHIFEQEIQKLTGGKTTMGIEEFLLEEARQEGRNEGRQEGIQTGINTKQAELTRNLLRETDFSTVKIAGLVGVSVQFVEQAKKNLVLNEE